MEKKSACGTSLKRAVSAARHVMHSRTGVAILKQSYVNKQRLPGRNVQIIEGVKDKELRRLASERTHFISKQDEKLQSPSSVRRMATSQISRKENELRRPMKEQNVPTFKQGEEAQSPISVRKTASNLNSIPGSLGNSKTQAPRLNSVPEPVGKMRRELSPELDAPSTSRKASRREKDQNNTTERIASPQESVQATDEQRSFTALTRDAGDRITKWIKEVNGANNTEQSTPVYEDFARSALQRCDSKTSSLRNIDGKRDAELKLPKIDKLPPSVGRSPRPTLKRYDSLVDPRFTNLMEALTPASKPLKLPSIVKEDPQRSS